MTTKKSTLEKYQAKFERAGREHAERLSAIRGEILADERLSDIERLVYGLTDSAEELALAQQLESRIAEALSDPILVVTKTKREEAWLGDKYTIGQIVGQLSVESNFDQSDAEYPEGALVVPVRNTLITRDGTIRKPENAMDKRYLTIAHYALTADSPEVTITRPITVQVGLEAILTSERVSPLVGGLVVAELEFIRQADGMIT